MLIDFKIQGYVENPEQLSKLLVLLNDNGFTNYAFISVSSYLTGTTVVLIPDIEPNFIPVIGSKIRIGQDKQSRFYKVPFDISPTIEYSSVAFKYPRLIDVLDKMMIENVLWLNVFIDSKAKLNYWIVWDDSIFEENN